MAVHGHLVAPHRALRGGANGREFFMEVFSPRYLHLYVALQDRPSLLVETTASRPPARAPGQL